MPTKLLRVTLCIVYIVIDEEVHKVLYQGREIYVRCCIARNPSMESVNVLCEIHRVNLKCNEMFNLFFIISFANRHDILSNLSLFYSSENLLNLFPEG